MLDVADCGDSSVSTLMIMVYLVEVGVLPTSLATRASGSFRIRMAYSVSLRDSPPLLARLLLVQVAYKDLP